MKKYFCMMVVATILTSVTFSSKAFSGEVLTPENLSGIWEYSCSSSGRTGGELRTTQKWKIILNNSLKGVIRSTYKKYWRLDGEGSIKGDAYTTRDLQNPEIIRMKLTLSNGKLEGTIHLLWDGDLYNFKKIRPLTADEQKYPMEKLEQLLEE